MMIVTARMSGLGSEYDEAAVNQADNSTIDLSSYWRQFGIQYSPDQVQCSGWDVTTSTTGCWAICRDDPTIMAPLPDSACAATKTQQSGVQQSGLEVLFSKRDTIIRGVPNWLLTTGVLAVLYVGMQ